MLTHKDPEVQAMLGLLESQRDYVMGIVAMQAKQIEELKIQNQELKNNSATILNQIKEYIKELEEIRNHYVDSNNNSKQ